MKDKKEKMTLAQLREAAGFTQEELGDIIGVGGKTIYNWESKKSIPRLKVPQVAQLLAVLPCTFTELVEICQEIERKKNMS